MNYRVKSTIIDADISGITLDIPEDAIGVSIQRVDAPIHKFGVHLQVSWLEPTERVHHV